MATTVDVTKSYIIPVRMHDFWEENPTETGITMENVMEYISHKLAVGFGLDSDLPIFSRSGTSYYRAIVLPNSEGVIPSGEEYTAMALIDIPINNNISNYEADLTVETDSSSLTRHRIYPGRIIVKNNEVTNFYLLEGRAYSSFMQYDNSTGAWNNSYETGTPGDYMRRDSSSKREWEFQLIPWINGFMWSWNYTVTTLESYPTSYFRQKNFKLIVGLYQCKIKDTFSNEVYEACIGLMNNTSSYIGIQILKNSTASTFQLASYPFLEQDSSTIILQPFCFGKYKIDDVYIFTHGSNSQVANYLNKSNYFSYGRPSLKDTIIIGNDHYYAPLTFGFNNPITLMFKNAHEIIVE